MQTERLFWHGSRTGCNYMELSKSQKMLILADPLSKLKQSGQILTQEQMSDLKEHQSQYLETKQKLSDSQDLSKKTSRLIGEAKRNGRATEHLLATMKEHGRTAKQLKHQLEAQIEIILSYFDTPLEHDQTQEKPAFPTARGHNKPTSAASEDVSISLLDGEI